MQGISISGRLYYRNFLCPILVINDGIHDGIHDGIDDGIDDGMNDGASYCHTIA